MREASFSFVFTNFLLSIVLQETGNSTVKSSPAEHILNTHQIPELTTHDFTTKRMLSPCLSHYTMIRCERSRSRRICTEIASEPKDTMR